MVLSKIDCQRRDDEDDFRFAPASDQNPAQTWLQGYERKRGITRVGGVNHPGSAFSLGLQHSGNIAESSRSWNRHTAHDLGAEPCRLT
jgi:hypothetical protein